MKNAVEWQDISASYGYPANTRMSGTCGGLRLGIGCYITGKWHWWVFAEDGRTLAVGRTDAWKTSQQQAEDFVYHYSD